MVDTARSADGTKIAYECTGDGPVLILAGGALNNWHSADALVPHLAETFSLLTFDRRGRGDSPTPPPYAPAREVEDLKALIDAVGGSTMSSATPLGPSSRWRPRRTAPQSCDSPYTSRPTSRATRRPEAPCCGR
jgi:pimeloyl-ACP methyl ester carboxylesterase